MRVRVDDSQCRNISQIIVALRQKETSIPPPREEILSTKLRRETFENVLWVVVAICHQTTPNNAPRLQGYIDGCLAIGWDYLFRKWIWACERDISIVTPQKLKHFSEEQLVELLYDEREGNRITDVPRRVALINDLGETIEGLGFTHISYIYNKSNGFIADINGKGLVTLLNDYKAYSDDPVKKKTYYFLSLMKNYGYWQFQDGENLGAPVDYHEVRGHLRYGTVRIEDPTLLQKLQRREPISEEEDVQIRKAVFEAIMLISREAKTDPNTLHYLFWNIFRNCCRRDETHCTKCLDHPALPARYAALKKDRCVFAENCLSADSESKIIDHVVDTAYH